MKKLKSKDEIAENWWNQKQCCTYLEKDPKTIRGWGLEPVAKLGNNRYYDCSEVIKKYVGLENNRNLVEGGSGEYIDVEQEQARKTRQERIKLELSNAKTMRDQAPVELLTFALDNLVSQMAAVMDGLVLTIKRETPDIPSAVLDIVDRELAKVRNMMADADIDFNEIDQ